MTTTNRISTFHKDSISTA